VRPLPVAVVDATPGEIDFGWCPVFSSDAAAIFDTAPMLAELQDRQRARKAFCKRVAEMGTFCPISVDGRAVKQCKTRNYFSRKLFQFKTWRTELIGSSGDCPTVPTLSGGLM
jgi:hypothetical protein